MTVRSIGEAVDRLDPTDVASQEPELWSVECSTVVFSSISAFGQQSCSVASEGYCISCVNPLRADLLGRCLFWLRQNLSFVIIPLKIASIGDAMSPLGKMPVKLVLARLPAF